MGECVVDNYIEDGFSEAGFDDWSTFSSAGFIETTKVDSEFSDWATFQESERIEEPAILTGNVQFLENTKNDNELNLSVIFNSCFPAAETEKDLIEVEIPTLSQLHDYTPDFPSNTAVMSRQASNLWHQLQSGLETLPLSGSKPKQHAHEGLIRSLQLRHPDTKSDSPPAAVWDLELDQEEPPAALIQTKLQPLKNCGNAPGFFYQISSQWLGMTQHNKHPLQ